MKTKFFGTSFCKMWFLLGYLLVDLSFNSFSKAYSGFLTSAKTGVGLFSFRSENEEATPNYVGLNLGLSTGFSFAQKLDFVVFGDYTQGNIAKLHLITQDASLIFLGAKVSWRYKETVIMSFKSGVARYQLYNVEGKEGEVPGIWEGPAASFSMGSLFKLNKRNFLQLSLEYMLSAMQPTKVVGDNTGTRSVDQISFGLSYTFNGFINELIEGSLFESFFK